MDHSGRFLILTVTECGLYGGYFNVSAEVPSIETEGNSAEILVGIEETLL